MLEFIMSAFWGYSIGLLGIQVIASLLYFFIYLYGFVLGRVERGNTGRGMVVEFGRVMLLVVLLFGIVWLMSKANDQGYHLGEGVFWSFVAIAVLIALIQFPRKITKIFRFATVPGAFEQDYLRSRQ